MYTKLHRGMATRSWLCKYMMNNKTQANYSVQFISAMQRNELAKSYKSRIGHGGAILLGKNAVNGDIYEPWSFINCHGREHTLDNGLSNFCIKIRRLCKMNSLFHALWPSWLENVYIVAGFRARRKAGNKVLKKHVSKVSWKALSSRKPLFVYSRKK